MEVNRAHYGTVTATERPNREAQTYLVARQNHVVAHTKLKVKRRREIGADLYGHDDFDVATIVFRTV